MRQRAAAGRRTVAVRTGCASHRRSPRQARLVRCSAAGTRGIAAIAPGGGQGQRAGPRGANAIFLLGLPAQHLDAGTRRQHRAGRHRLPHHGRRHEPSHVDADPDGWRGPELDGHRAVHRNAARIPEPRRRHLLPLGPARSARRRAGRREYHLQGPLQRRCRHDGWTARRRAPVADRDLPPTARGTRQARCDRLGRPRQVPRGGGRRADGRHDPSSR